MRLRDSSVESDEVIFDPDGRMMLVRDSDVVMLETGSTTDAVLRSVLGRGGGALRFMPDGTLLVADFSGDTTTRYDLGSRRVLFRAATRSPMKMALDPRGRLYVSSRDGFIYLVDTRTGARQVLSTPDTEVGGLAFSPDFRTLYAGLLRDESIAAFPIDPDGSLGQRRVLARGIAFPMAMAVDECGSVYAAGGSDGEVRRISPAGRVDVILRSDMPELWGMAFGSGKHGWSDTALYITSDSNGNRGLFEVQLGVRGAPPPLAP
jgi:sugar lactone lactonase YvrE